MKLGNQSDQPRAVYITRRVGLKEMCLVTEVHVMGGGGGGNV